MKQQKQGKTERYIQTLDQTNKYQCVLRLSLCLTLAAQPPQNHSAWVSHIADILHEHYNVNNIAREQDVLSKCFQYIFIRNDTCTQYHH